MNNSSEPILSRTSPPRMMGGLCQLHDEATLISYVILLIMLAIISTFENILVIIAICKYKALRTTSVLLFGVLAVIDLTTASVVTPMKVWITLMVDLQYMPDLGAFLWMFGIIVNLSLCIMLLIGIDRFCHTLFLERYKLTMKKFVLGLLFVLTVPMIVILFEALGQYRAEVLWLAVAYSIFTIIAMIITCIGMCVSLKRQTTSSNEGSRLNYIKEQWQSVRTTLILIGVFICMHVVPVVSMITVGFAHEFSSAMCAITFFSLLASSAVNPLIYGFRTPIIKKHILKLLGRKRVVEDDNKFLMEVDDALQMDSC